MYDQAKYGAIAESLFIARCLKHNLNASRPAVDVSGFDFIVSSKSLCDYKVQVKSTIAPELRKDTTYRINIQSNINYKKSGVKFIVLYLHSIEAFYIVPIDKIPKKTHIRVYPYKANCKFAMYRDAWHLFI